MPNANDNLVWKYMTGNLMYANVFHLAIMWHHWWMWTLYCWSMTLNKKRFIMNLQWCPVLIVEMISKRQLMSLLGICGSVSLEAPLLYVKDWDRQTLTQHLPSYYTYTGTTRSKQIIYTHCKWQRAFRDNSVVYQEVTLLMPYSVSSILLEQQPNSINSHFTPYTKSDSVSSRYSSKGSGTTNQHWLIDWYSSFQGWQNGRREPKCTTPESG